LALFGIGFSTISAQSPRSRLHLALLTIAAEPDRVRARRRRRRSGSTSSCEPESACIAASYSRYSSDQQREESITDQRRKCNEAAARNEHQILPELEYADEAVSGTKLRRDGLNALLRDAEAGEFQVLYFHSLSRLARESVITMPLLKRLVYVNKVRIISVTEGIDSARDGWDVIATIMALLHERYIKELGENVFRGQEGTVLAGICVGDYRFGYKSVPIPGSEKTRRGRNVKSRMTYVIDEFEAAWVIRIFHWFVVERRSLSWIVRELNRRGAPKDHRATTKYWHHNLVAGVLSSSKYIGTWPWGEMKNVRDPMTGIVHQEPRSEEECEKWRRYFPHLRIIDDELFTRAQALLQENFDKYAAHRRANGRLKWSECGRAEDPPRHLLQGLIKCKECGSRFFVTGANAKYLACPGYKRGICSCQTQLRRDRAERLILREIGKRILSDPAWFNEVLRQQETAWQKQEGELPTELSATERAIADVDQKIARLVDRIESGDTDPEISRRLQERRLERRQLVRTRDQLASAIEQQHQPPTESWIRDRIENLHAVLQDSAPAAAYALRALVGGQIEVEEVRREGKQRHYLRGQFLLRSTAVANAAVDAGLKVPAPELEIGAGVTEQIVIDFVDPNPLDEPSEQAKALYDQGMLAIEIAARLGCSKSQITKLLHHWYESEWHEVRWKAVFSCELRMLSVA